MAQLKPGVVSGKDYLTLVGAAKAGGYALPAVNVSSSSTINAVLEAAAKNQADVIVQLSNGGAQFYAGQGMKDGFKAKVLGAVSAAMHVHLLAEHYGVCVVLHTDHANKGLIPWVEALLDHGEAYFKQHGKPLFSSHMLDLSEDPMEFNLSECARILTRMAPLDMSLEIELGVTGGEEDGIGGELDESADNSHLYTQPEDVLQAYERLSPIGHFSVAASFGNVHGVYKPGNVQLRPEILKNSQALIEKECKTAAKPLNLVFHGGSGSEKAKITEAVGYGVFKMNIDTDLQFAYSEAIGKFVTENPKAFLYQIDPETDKPYKKFYDPRKYLRAAEQNMVARLNEAFTDLGSKGKSLCL
ncbi:MAG TPA: class II fructose-bisphosphate aldolase [Gammaproteobacteria bacterium]|nr:class II fructose-bisphosphate aldolase [Candidatus Competibacteraceae bacterium]MCP5133396.1 class II fructose-bisphosphate aldolase [Gammaproteobacteria bacterium]HCB13361.1 class II fructose-bisphosphate aldolase [Gammaproteobacteria bacterium]HPF57211.1 class II fructose-bisphosphate aldolase [Candidatus Competibacteraceae bacterium]HRF42661.1 class II fructose-bisphosphate aldolase [Candidatus Competibacteraceae bacterium]